MMVQWGKFGRKRIDVGRRGDLHWSGAAGIGDNYRRRRAKITSTYQATVCKVDAARAKARSGA